MNADFSTLLTVLHDYAAGKTYGENVVRTINALVATDAVYSWSPDLCNAVLDLQDEVALYVEDRQKREQFSGYFGDDRLTEIVKGFLKVYS